MPFKISLFITASLAVAGILPLAHAQTPETKADAESRQDTVIVQATRRGTPTEALPNTVRLIDEQALSDQLLISTSILDAIGTQVPSFAPTRQKLSGLGESFRGRSPLYLIDGVPQSNPLRDGSRDGFTFDPAVIERVEVLFGANAIQGVGATGGVINYVTLSPADVDQWQFRSEAAVTTDTGFKGDGFGYRGAVTVLRDFGPVDLVASYAGETRGAFYDAEDRRIGVDGVQGDIQDSVSHNLFAKLGWDIDVSTRLQLTLNRFELEGDGDYLSLDGDRPNGVPTTSIRGTAQGEVPTNIVTTVSMDFTRAEVLGGTFSAQGFYQDFESVFGGGVFEVFQDPAFGPVGSLFDQSANNSEKYGLKLTYNHSDLPVEGLSVTGGLDILNDLTFQELTQTGRNWVPEVEFISYAPFIQFDQEFLDGRGLVSFGARNEFATVSVADYTTLFSYGPQQVDGGEPEFSEFLLNGGARFDVVDGLSVYGSYSEGFTMPDVGRVLRGIDTPNVDIDDLLRIEPIVADNTELGVTLESGLFTGNASYFWSDSDFGQRLAPGADGFFVVARERTEIEGFELALEYESRDGLLVGGNYAALEGRFDSDGDNSVDRDLDGVNISPDRLNLYISSSLTDRFSVRAQTSIFMDRVFDDAGDATDFNGYATVDLSGGYTLPANYGRLDIGLQNAFNEDYITYYSQTGSTRNDRFFAGRGRTVTLRWSASY